MSTTNVFFEPDGGWYELERYRPVAGLRYEKHPWPGVVDGVPGLGIRLLGAPAEPLSLRRVVLQGAAVSDILKQMFPTAGFLFTERLSRVSRADCEQAISRLWASPETYLVAARDLARHPIRLLRRLKAPTLPLIAEIAAQSSWIATPLASTEHDQPGVVLYALDDIRGIVEAAAERAGHPLSRLSSALRVAADVRLPSTDEVRPVAPGVIDVSEANVLVGARHRGVHTLSLDGTAASDLDALADWDALEVLSLRGLAVRSLAPIARPGIKRLSLSGALPASQFTALSAATDLTHLSIFGGRLGDLSFLCAIPSLRSVSFYGVALPSLAPLGEPVGLESLTIAGTGELDAAALPTIAGLRDLSLVGLDGHAVSLRQPSAIARQASLVSLSLTATDVTDISWLSPLTGLRSLNLHATDVVDVSILSRWPGLEQLNLHATPVTDLGFLPSLAALRTLDVSFTPALSQLSLASLHGGVLTELGIRGQRLSDLRSISHLSSLRCLHCEPIKSADGIAALPRLENLLGGELSDLAPLAGHAALQRLSLARSRVEDVGVLATLSSLRALDLSDSAVRSLAPLAQCSKLTTLNVRGVSVDMAPVRGLALRELDMSMSTVSGTSGLLGQSALQRLNINHARLDRLDWLADLSSLRQLRAAGVRIPAPVLRAFPPLSRLEVSRGAVPPGAHRALRLRHRLTLRD